MKYLAELIGTFFLVLTVGCTVMAGSPGVIAPLAIGSALMVMVYAGGHVSGAHVNPAVTIGLWIRGRCPAAEIAPYVGSQILGGILAAIVAGYLRSDADVTALMPNVPRALAAEALFTFALVYVVLNVATAKGTVGNSFYGLAIGFTVLVGAFAVGDISGGAFNPAVGIGITVMGLGSWNNVWIYLVAPIAGAVAAAFAFKTINPEDK
jgi:aquaporin Z